MSLIEIMFPSRKYNPMNDQSTAAKAEHVEDEPEKPSQTRLTRSELRQLFQSRLANRF